MGIKYPVDELIQLLTLNSTFPPILVDLKEKTNNAE